MARATNVQRKPKLADHADRYVLYEQSVQDVDTEIEFLKETFEEARGRGALSLREDFCGTAQVACKWAASDPQCTAIGVDLDPEPLAWGEEHNRTPLPEAVRRRVRFVEGNVLDAPGENLDLVIAMNFSYWIFEDRETLRHYFQRSEEHTSELQSRGHLVCRLLLEKKKKKNKHTKTHRVEYITFEISHSRR